MQKRQVSSGPAEARGAWGRQKGAQGNPNHVDVRLLLGALGAFLRFPWVIFGPSWARLGQANGSTGQRVDGTTGNGSTESGSVAGSGAQPLLDNSNNNNETKIDNINSPGQRPIGVLDLR